MTMEQIIGFAVALLLMCVGILGNLVPGLPGTPLVLLAAVLHRLYFGQASVSNLVLVLLVGLTLLALGVDYLASMWGAKKLGATWRGMLGAVLGALVGVFFGLPGILLAPFLGALALEMAGGRDINEAAQAGAGALLGLFVGALGKLACSVAMFALFATNVMARSALPAEAQAIVGLVSARAACGASRAFMRLNSTPQQSLALPSSSPSARRRRKHRWTRVLPRKHDPN